MTTSYHRNFFSTRQLGQTVLVIVCAVFGVFAAAFAADWSGWLAWALVAAAGAGAVAAGLLVAGGRTGWGLLVAVVPLLAAAAVIVFTRGDNLAVAGYFLGENIMLAWQSFANR